MRINLEKALRKAIRFLEKQNIRFAVIGGLAVSYWGFDRYTEDVDFKIFVPSSDFPAMRALIRKSFPINARPHLPPNSPVVAVTIDGVTVDFGLGYPGYDAVVIERAVQVTIKNFKLWYATAEDLIVLKMIADCGKDWFDIEGLTKARYHELDFKYIEDWLTQFDEWLDDKNLVGRYKEVIANAKKVNAKS